MKISKFSPALHAKFGPIDEAEEQTNEPRVKATAKHSERLSYPHRNRQLSQ